MNGSQFEIVAINIVVAEIKYSVIYFRMMAKGIECNKCEDTTLPIFTSFCDSQIYINRADLYKENHFPI